MKISAMKCDRCGKLFIPEKKGGWSIHFVEVDEETMTEHKYDLCPGCEEVVKQCFKEGHEAA